MTVLHIDNTPPRKPEDAGKTDGEIWNEKMQEMLRSHFPWRAVPDRGVWYLYDSMGACLARFNLDSGHGARLAASAPDLLLQQERIWEAIKALRHERLYENATMTQGVAVKFLARLTMLEVAAGMRPADDRMAMDAKRELAVE